MARRLSIAATLWFVFAASACSDGPTPARDPVAVAMEQLSPAYLSDTERSGFAWYAIAALEHGADLTRFTADVDGQARTFDGVALGIIYDEMAGVGGSIYRDSLVVLVGWRGADAREMIAVAHLSDNYPTAPMADLRPGPVERTARALPFWGSEQRTAIGLPARSVSALAAGDLALHYLWYMTDNSVWIDSIVRTAHANLTFGAQPCETRILQLPPGYGFDTQNFPCYRGTLRQSIDVRVWPEVDSEGQPLAQGRFNLVMRPAEYALPNFLDLLQ